MPNLYANWPAPANVFALTTTRNNGLSQLPYNTNNFGLHVGDMPETVFSNRKALRNTLKRPQEPEWLEQTHSNLCVIVEDENNRIADAAVTRSSARTLVIMTADCLPIMLCNKQGTEVAAVHSGWRGLANGIIENTLNKMHSTPDQLLAWIGPAICQSCYEVGNEVLESYQTHYNFSQKGFRPQGNKWLADLPLLAELVLNSIGVSAVFQSKICTFEQINDFYSYRRTPQTGRMATLIGFNDTNQDK